MEIRQITDNLTKQSIARLILEALPDWFGIPEAREEYITESVDQMFFCAFDDDKPLVFKRNRQRNSGIMRYGCFERVSSERYWPDTIQQSKRGSG